MSQIACSFEISPKAPRAHIFQVRCIVPSPSPEGQRFALPSWIPGSYLIREFAKNIVTISAKSASRKLEIAKLNKDTWQCEPTNDAIVVEYDVYAWDLSIRAAFLDDRQGFFNGTSVFLRPLGLEHLPCEVQISPPTQAVTGNWTIATSLSAASIDERGFGRYQAQNYDELVDHPVQMGSLERIAFDVLGTPHHLIVSNQHRGDLARIAKDLTSLCATQIQFFGEPAPFKSYQFLLRVEDDAYGGLEHRASSALLCKRSDLPLPGDKRVSETYRTFLGLCSHEYFHAWNVKRLKPKAFVPYNLNSENYTQLLWFFEGFTSYYDDLFLLRSGLINQFSYLELLARTMTRVYRGQGRLKQTLAESSFDSWIKFYRPDENTPNAVVSYYTKGSLVALALDLTIRLATQSKRSLDDVMRLLWERFGKPQSGVDEESIMNAANEVAQTDLSSFFAHAVHSTQDMPLAALLAEFGVSCEFRPQEHEKDEGGSKHKARAEDAPVTLYLGAKFKRDEFGALTIAYVDDEGPAQKAGLAVGDTMVAIDALRVRPGNLDTLLASYRPGQAAKVHAFRRGELMETTLVLTPGPANTCDLIAHEDLPGEIKERRDKWLGLKV
jgi:predicted metalloprotease with PDZ domain